MKKYTTFLVDDSKLMINSFEEWCTDVSTLNLISGRGYCWRFSPFGISNTLKAKYDPAENQSSDLVEWKYAVVTITTPRRLFYS